MSGPIGQENSFQNALNESIKEYSYLFDPRVLVSDQEFAPPQSSQPTGYYHDVPTHRGSTHSIPSSYEGNRLEVQEINLPTKSELSNLESEETEWENWEYEWDKEPLMEEDGDIWNDLPIGNGITMRDGTTTYGTEILAVYRSFHFYRNWGVLFFEAPMESHSKRIFHYFKRRRINHRPKWCLKAAFYAVARHEFFHYLTDLTSLQYEVQMGRSTYIPYKKIVKPQLEKIDQQIEETVADYWYLNNTVVRKNKGIWREMNLKHRTNSYRRGAIINDSNRKDLEDEIVAQMLQCTPNPSQVPKVWGSLPRPYVQPWTRYENVRWMTDRGVGGTIANQVNNNPLKKTITIEI